MTTFIATVRRYPLELQCGHVAQGPNYTKVPETGELLCNACYGERVREEMRRTGKARLFLGTTLSTEALLLLLQNNQEEPPESMQVYDRAINVVSDKVHVVSRQYVDLVSRRGVTRRTTQRLYFRFWFEGEVWAGAIGCCGGSAAVKRTKFKKLDAPGR
jgi:hypothetical protein